MTKKIGFIGCGNMARALIRAFISSKAMKPGQILASDRHDRPDFVNNTGISMCSNSEVIDSADIIFICVKPQDVDSVIDEIQGSDKLFVSIAAGVATKKYADKGMRVVRIMPSLNCEVNEMVSAVNFPNNIKDDEKRQIKKLLDSVGKSFELKEEQFDAFTAVSGSGVGFFAYLIDCFAKIAEKHGLENAFEIINMTALGTSKLMKEKNMSAEELTKKVMSPGGTTEAGIKVLEDSDLMKIFEETIEAAIKRAKELGK